MHKPSIDRLTPQQDSYLPALILFILLLLGLITESHAAESPAMTFDDRPLADNLNLPNWFNLSFLDLNDSLEEAINDNKSGLIIYFGRKDCAYCKALLEVNWGDPGIAKYTQQHFNVIAIDVRGDRTVTDFNNQHWSEKDYATHMRTNFTPTLLFYNRQGQLTLRLPGYRPKYQFRAALEYVADAHYNRETFRQYLSRAHSALSFGMNELNENELFINPPYNLDSRKSQAADKRKPLMVFFEHPKCHACDVLHGDTLSNPDVIKKLEQLELVQLNTYKQTPLITPDGQHTTARQWADDLNLTFAPALIFYDEKGMEILRIESVIRFYRLNNVLDYITGRNYLQYPTLQSWLQHKRSETQNTP